MARKSLAKTRKVRRRSNKAVRRTGKVSRKGRKSRRRTGGMGMINRMVERLNTIRNSQMHVGEVPSSQAGESDRDRMKVLDNYIKVMERRLQGAKAELAKLEYEQGQNSKRMDGYSNW